MQLVVFEGKLFHYIIAVYVTAVLSVAEHRSINIDEQRDVRLIWLILGAQRSKCYTVNGGANWIC